MANQEESSALAAYWQQQIESWKQSGQPQKLYCKEQGLNYYRFGYWRRKFLKADQAANIQDSSAFVSVAPLPQRTGTDLSLNLPNGIVIQGIEQRNILLVVQLLAQLK